jgi:peptidyl-prolyl cis-trans isomerase C
LNNFYALPLARAINPLFCRKLLCTALIGVVAAGLVACGSKENKAGQSLARVDGEEITVLQINDELQRANVQHAQQEAASKQILDSLIDRQLIVAEAIRNKIDRTPDVMQAIGRAKSQIIAQAYMRGITARVAKPGKLEIDEYFNQHPEFFAKRKQFDMAHVVIASSDFNDELKSALQPAKSMDEVVAWLDMHKVQYKRGRLLRTTADLPAEMSAKLVELQKGNLFVVNEGDKTMLITLLAVKDVPVTAKDAAPQIEQYLINKKTREMAETEIAHLRSLAKIEYLNASAPVAAAPTPPVAQVLAAPEIKPAVGL